MKFGTGSTTELTQKYTKVKVQMTYVHPHIYVRIIALVTMLFGINSMSNAIEIARGFTSCYFNCFTSAIDP